MNAFLVTLLIPVSATALGVAFPGETPLPRHLAGMALIAVGLSVIDGRLWRRRAARARRTLEAPPTTVILEAVQRTGPE